MRRREARVADERHRHVNERRMSIVALRQRANLCLRLRQRRLTNGGTQLSFPPTNLSLKWYFKLLTDRQLLSAFGLSLWIGLVSTAIALLAGTAALAINHYTFSGRATIRTTLLLPLSLPGVVLGLGLLFGLSTFGLRPGVTATIIGHSVIDVPFIVNFLLSTLAHYDLDLERASMNLGATRWQTFVLITLPLIRPGLTRWCRKMLTHRPKQRPLVSSPNSVAPVA